MLRCIYIIIGSISLGLGVLGIFLPVLPTTPFLLLAAALFFRSSPRLYRWLLGHKYLGPYIRNFLHDRSIPLHVKILVVSLLWITAINCICFVFDNWWLKGLMGGIALGVTVYVLSFKTRRVTKEM